MFGSFQQQMPHNPPISDSEKERRVIEFKEKKENLQRCMKSVLNNKTLRKIVFGKVSEIHKLIIDTKQGFFGYLPIKTLKWNDMLKNPLMLLKYEYYDLFEQSVLKQEEEYSRFKWYDDTKPVELLSNDDDDDNDRDIKKVKLSSPSSSSSPPPQQQQQKQRFIPNLSLIIPEICKKRYNYMTNQGFWANNNNYQIVVPNGPMPIKLAKRLIDFVMNRYGTYIKEVYYYLESGIRIYFEIELFNYIWDKYLSKVKLFKDQTSGNQQSQFSKIKNTFKLIKSILKKEKDTEIEKEKEKVKEKVINHHNINLNNDNHNNTNNLKRKSPDQKEESNNGNEESPNNNKEGDSLGDETKLNQLIKQMKETVLQSINNGDHDGSAIRLIKKIHQMNDKRLNVIIESELMDRAAQRGLLSIVKYLHENNLGGCTKSAIDLASASGQFLIVKFLHANRTEGCTTDAMDNCSNVYIVKFLHENRPEGCTKKALDNALRNNQVEIVKFLFENRTEGYNPDVVDQLYHHEIIDYLIERKILTLQQVFESILHRNRYHNSAKHFITKVIDELGNVDFGTSQVPFLLAIQQHDIPFLEKLFSIHNPDNYLEYFVRGIQYKSIKTLRFLDEHGFNIVVPENYLSLPFSMGFKGLFHMAAGTNDASLELYQLLNEKGNGKYKSKNGDSEYLALELEIKAQEYLSQRDNKPMIHYLVDKVKIPINEPLLYSSMTSGNMDTLKFMISRYQQQKESKLYDEYDDYQELTHDQIASFMIPIIKSRLNELKISFARMVQLNHFEMIKFVVDILVKKYNEQCEPTDLNIQLSVETSTFNQLFSIENGRPLLLYLQEKGFISNFTQCEVSNFQCVQSMMTLHDMGVKFSTSVFNNSLTSSGHSDHIRFLYFNSDFSKINPQMLCNLEGSPHVAEFLLSNCPLIFKDVKPNPVYHKKLLELFNHYVKPLITPPPL